VLRPDYRFRLIVQTHVSAVTPALADTMVALGVEVVEIGFETASSTVLAELRKHGGARAYHDALAVLRARGLRVILNGGSAGCPTRPQTASARPWRSSRTRPIRSGSTTCTTSFRIPRHAVSRAAAANHRLGLPELARGSTVVYERSRGRRSGVDHA